MRSGEHGYDEQTALGDKYLRRLIEHANEVGLPIMIHTLHRDRKREPCAPYYALDWAAWRFPALRPMLKSPPLALVENGRILRGNLRAEMLSKDELMSQLREEGIDDIKKVRRAQLEGDGRLSVIKQGG